MNGLGSGERFLPRIVLRIPRQFASRVLNVLPHLINVECFPAVSAGSPKSGQRQAGILRDTSRESTKFLPPAAQQIDPGRVHDLT